MKTPASCSAYEQAANGTELAHLSSPRKRLTRVALVCLCTNTPMRHLVCFLGDDSEGHEERVVPSR
jgi:hypothetical protein